MNGFASLDIPPCRRYVVVKATAGFAVCRLILKLPLFYSCLDFTQNLGKTLCLNKDSDMVKLSYLYANIIAFASSFVIIFLLYGHDKRMNDCLPPILFSAIFKLLKVLPDTELDAC